jgi:hypothetical protein
MQAQESQPDILLIEDNLQRSSTITIKKISHAGRISDGKFHLQRKKTGLVLPDLSLSDSFGLQKKALSFFFSLALIFGSWKPVNAHKNREISELLLEFFVSETVFAQEKNESIYHNVLYPRITTVKANKYHVGGKKSCKV